MGGLLRDLISAYEDVKMVVKDFEQRPLRVGVAFRGVLRLQNAVDVAMKAAIRMKTYLPSTLLDRIRSYAKDIENVKRQLRELNPNDILATPVADHLYKLSPRNKVLHREPDMYHLYAVGVISKVR